MKQIKLAFVLLTIMIVLGNCTFENRTTTTKMCLEDLDINVQDTLRNLPVDSFGCHPDLIDLTGHYKLTIKEIGPWCYAQKLENLETGKFYWFDYSTPRPIIVTAEEIIFPMEYNIVNRGVESTDTFNIIDNQLRHNHNAPAWNLALLVTLFLVTINSSNYEHRYTF